MPPAPVYEDAPPVQAPEGDETGEKPGGRTIPFLTVLIPLVTALVTFVATVAGLWWPTNQDRNEQADRAAVLEEETQDLSVELEAQQEANVSLQDEADRYASTIDSLQDQLDQVSTTTSVESPEGDGDGGGLPRGPDGEVAVFRETGDRPLRFNEDYEANLDTLDDDWGVARSIASGDLALNESSATGLELRVVGSNVVAVMDHDATYEQCDATTNLQTELGSALTTEGTQFCVQTNRGRWAFVTILEVGRDDGYIVLDITVWAPET